MKFDCNSKTAAEDNKRICFVTTLPVTLKAFVHPQAEYLLQNGWDVTWICAADPNFQTERVEQPKTGFGMPLDAWLRHPLKD
jgi:hypothetical protein